MAQDTASENNTKEKETQDKTKISPKNLLPSYSYRPNIMQMLQRQTRP